MALDIYAFETFLMLNWTGIAICFWKISFQIKLVAKDQVSQEYLSFFEMI